MANCCYYLKSDQNIQRTTLEDGCFTCKKRCCFTLNIILAACPSSDGVIEYSTRTRVLQLEYHFLILSACTRNPRYSVSTCTRRLMYSVLSQKKRRVHLAFARSK